MSKSAERLCDVGPHAPPGHRIGCRCHRLRIATITSDAGRHGTTTMAANTAGQDGCRRAARRNRGHPHPLAHSGPPQRDSGSAAVKVKPSSPKLALNGRWSTNPTHQRADPTSTREDLAAGHVQEARRKEKKRRR